MEWPFSLHHTFCHSNYSHQLWELLRFHSHETSPWPVYLLCEWCWSWHHFSSVSVNCKLWVSIHIIYVTQCKNFNAILYNSILSSPDPPTGVALQTAPASVNNGSSITIRCTGHSQPPPEFTIIRRLADGNESTSVGDTFLLQPTSREELGYNSLTCSATNSKYSTPVLSDTHSILIKGELNRMDNKMHLWFARILKLLCINSLSNLGAPDIVDSNSIHTTSRSFTSVSVQWTTPQDNFDAIRNYRFQLGKCETSGNSSSPCQPVRTPQYQLSFNSPFHTFDNLSPFTTYRLEMAAYNGVGYGPYSNAVEVQTVQPGWPYY